MSDTPVFGDFQRIARNEMLARNPDVAIEAVDRDGSDANVIVATIAAAADEDAFQLVQLTAALFLDSAEGRALDRLVFDRYGLTRKPASLALGTAVFKTVAANPTPFTIPAGTSVTSSDGRQYVTTAAATFPVGAFSLPVQIRSVLAGAKQQAAIGAITSIAGTISGGPADLSVSNLVATVGAADAEPDADLRDRARRFFPTARRGTLAALEAGALAVQGVRRAKAIEITDVLGRPAGGAQVIVADAFTDALAQLGGTSPSYMVQSQALALSVFNGLSDVRAAGVFVQVIVAQVVLQPILLNLHFHAGVDVDTVATIARSTVLAYVNSLAPGDVLDPANLLRVISTVQGLDFQGDEIQSPPGTVDPTPLQVIRTALALVSAGLSTGTPAGATSNPDALG